MLAMALKPFGERSFVRLMKLPAALLTRPVRGPSLKTRVIIFSTASGDRMPHSIGVTRVLCVSASSRAVSATTAPRRPQMYTSAPSLANSPAISRPSPVPPQSEEHTSELQSQSNLVCRLLLEKKKKKTKKRTRDHRSILHLNSIQTYT